MSIQTRHIFFVLTILLSPVFVTGTTIILDNSPISTVSPASYFPAKDNPWIQPKDNYIYNSTEQFVPSNVWWMNLIMQGGTGFYSLTVVETPEDVIDASQQISIEEMESLGYQNVKNGTVYQVTRDVFDPNNNQGCYFIISSPVGFRFSQQEVITNNSNEYRANRDWSFQVSCFETVLYNPAIGPPGNSSQNWLFKAISWSDLTVNLQYINKNQNGYLETSQTRFSPYQTFFYSGTITPVVSVNGGRLFQTIQVLVGAGSVGTNTYSGTQFLITMSDSTQWLLFTSSTFTFYLGRSEERRVG